MRGHIKLELDAVGYGSIEVDGQPLRGVRACLIRAQVGGPTTVLLEFIGYGVQLEGPADILAQLVDPERAEQGLVDITTMRDTFRTFAKEKE